MAAKTVQFLTIYWRVRPTTRWAWLAEGIRFFTEGKIHTRPRLYVLYPYDGEGNVGVLAMAKI